MSAPSERTRMRSIEVGGVPIAVAAVMGFAVSSWSSQSSAGDNSPQRGPVSPYQLDDLPDSSPTKVGAIKAIQQGLSHYCVDVGPADGVMGRSTGEAVVAFSYSIGNFGTYYSDTFELIPLDQISADIPVRLGVCAALSAVNVSCGPAMPPSERKGWDIALYTSGSSGST